MLNQSVIGQTENLGWKPLNILTLKVILRSKKRSNFKVIHALRSCNISEERYRRDKYFGNILGQNIHLVSEKCRSKCICDNVRQNVDATQIVSNLIFMVDGILENRNQPTPDTLTMGWALPDPKLAGLSNYLNSPLNCQRSPSNCHNSPLNCPNCPSTCPINPSNCHNCPSDCTSNLSDVPNSATDCPNSPWSCPNSPQNCPNSPQITKTVPLIDITVPQIAIAVPQIATTVPQNCINSLANSHNGLSNCSTVSQIARLAFLDISNDTKNNRMLRYPSNPMSPGCRSIKVFHNTYVTYIYYLSDEYSDLKILPTCLSLPYLSFDILHADIWMTLKFDFLDHKMTLKWPLRSKYLVASTLVFRSGLWLV